jgi:DNA-directed RNA polymerase specialized sigma24 family protein
MPDDEGRDRPIQIEQTRRISQGEVVKLVRSLPNAELLRLYVIARNLLSKYRLDHLHEPNELVHEAYERAQTRVYGLRRGVDIMAVLITLMKNVRSEWSMQARRARAFTIDGVIYLQGSQVPDAENTQSALSAYQSLLDTFADDHVCTEIIRLRTNGYDSLEIRQKIGLTRKAFNSACRKIRRHWNGLVQGKLEKE